MDLICSQCNHKQTEGNFCEECGGKLVVNPNPPVASEPSINEDHVQVNMSSGGVATVSRSPVKTENVFSNYFSNFVTLAKNPTKAFKAGEGDFATGLISLALFAVVFGFTIYSFLDSIISDHLGSSFIPLEQISVPFFEVFSRVAFFALVFLAIGFISMLVMVKIAKSPLTAKTLISQFSGLVVPFTVVNVIALILTYIGAFNLSLILLFGSLFFVTYIVPALLTMEVTRNTSEQRVYASIGAPVIAMIIAYIFISNTVVDYLRQVDEFLSSFPLF
ncbi:DNA-directed RNA polymerase subunit RPC12/RpoP [Salirhabdus euzebyi]|uniref:DNA-directed RNA polymerase subunit RPC12/RpoP n=1 Tax=Salirhabdus euzebyi TaxID=394506 RepID=A0A841Q8A6_9BACI|nr:hypothetical protein [Salirhabdus euzebyi]MBB6454615.1 DNA-directed RNA polymerase subunit RPC12/RpoP [Salirhabdus euzebyi]